MNRNKSTEIAPLSSSISKLSTSSRALPSNQDFHFYNNFDEFKLPIQQIADSSQSMLGSIGSSQFLGKKMGFFPQDLDDARELVESVNDEVLGRFDLTVDAFQRRRKEEEEEEERGALESGFQLVCGKKKKKKKSDGVEDSSPSSAVKVVSRDRKAMGVKPKVPFHIPTIPRPQDEFKIVVNNSNQPFDHVWLQRSQDGSRSLHPQENCSVLDFVDRKVGDGEHVKPLPIESTRFKLVEEVNDLKELAAKLRRVNEFAVDLEHNQYRSFQGLTCLMQISTRTEDFVIDTLKLRIHIGPYLREVFKDPTKKKVMHGADRDILWLQRDFGIYVCNLFDTGQASRVLKLERNSLEYLLCHFCGVTANKEYQNADWRIRPLPDEMVRYAREDTHYLLHIYDLLRLRLLSASTESENSDDLLVEVYKRSYDLCMLLYEKELLTDSSYLYVYGLQDADLNAHQLAIVAGLCEWRDVIARAEDESTGYVLPKKTLLEIAKQMPVTTSKLRHLVKSKHPYVERNLGSVVSIIRHSMQNAAAFEAIAEHLKKGYMGSVSEENRVFADGIEALPPEVSTRLKTATETQSIGGGFSINGSMSAHVSASVHFTESLELARVTAANNQNGNIMRQRDNTVPELPRERPIISGQSTVKNTNLRESHLDTRATVQILAKPSNAFGAMLGNSATKWMLDPAKNEEEGIKLGQIKSSVNLPFHSFLGGPEQLHSLFKKPAKVLDMRHVDSSAVQTGSSNLEDVISLEHDSNVEKSETDEATNELLKHGTDQTLEMDDGDETMSLSDLSSSFNKCFESMSQIRKPKQAEKSKESSGLFQLKPFDYEAARQNVRFGEIQKEKSGEEDGDRRSRCEKLDRKRNSVLGQSNKDEGDGNFPQGRRRQAFPASGNRNATFS